MVDIVFLWFHCWKTFNNNNNNNDDDDDDDDNNYNTVKRTHAILSMN